jgi:quercetin dioxygenase-like cupin family protein
MKFGSRAVDWFAKSSALFSFLIGCATGHDSQVMVRQAPPHGGAGESTAYRYFDELSDANLIFRKRALHPGASIGLHPLEHDEVYYVASGRGELEVDGSRHDVVSGTAVFLYRGARVGIRQLGDSDLVLIIAYPPVSR